MDSPDNKNDTDGVVSSSVVKLEWAYRWTCSFCRHIQYERTVAIEMTEAQIKTFIGLEPWEVLTEEDIQLSSCFTNPTMITCKKCRTKYVVDPPDDIFDPDMMYDVEDDIDDDDIDEDSY